LPALSLFVVPHSAGLLVMRSPALTAALASVIGF